MKVSYTVARVSELKLAEEFGDDFKVLLKKKKLVLKGQPNDSLLMIHNRKEGFVKISDGTTTTEKEPVFNRGGSVFCHIVDEKTGKESVGVSYCSFSDNFDYRKGKQIAYGRALKTLT
jgi:hypothetical protein